MATEEKLVCELVCAMSFPIIVNFLIRYKLPSNKNLFFSSSLTPAVLAK